ncbi:hypothetical protein DOY81_006862 [Sarcophaga bullata]|nr:hypothetical protein DOY81_006862 [Sarcophaga bullata]
MVFMKTEGTGELRRIEQIGNIQMPVFILGDSAFNPSTNLMKPYPFSMALSGSDVPGPGKEHRNSGDNGTDIGVSGDGADIVAPGDDFVIINTN